MKPAILILLSIFLGLAACRKEANEPYLVVSKDSLMLGEMVVAKVINARPATRFVWYSIGAMGEAIPKGDKVRMSYSFRENAPSGFPCWQVPILFPMLLLQKRSTYHTMTLFLLLLLPCLLRGMQQKR
jgi:hypothetical protein